MNISIRVLLNHTKRPPLAWINAQRATHSLCHRWHFVANNARPLSGSASVHRCHELKSSRCFHACIHTQVWHFSIKCDPTGKFIWLILSTIMQNGDIVLDMLEFCYFWYCFSQRKVTTRCRCGGKYDTDLVANLLLTVKEFKKSMDIYHSNERRSS